MFIINTRRKMLLTVKQFSEQNNIPLQLCYDHIERQLLPVQKTGSVYLVDTDSLSEYQQNLARLEQQKKQNAVRATKARLNKLQKLGK
jgi:hypothetical protein